MTIIINDLKMDDFPSITYYIYIYYYYYYYIIIIILYYIYTYIYYYIFLDIPPISQLRNSQIHTISHPEVPAPGLAS